MALTLARIAVLAVSMYVLVQPQIATGQLLRNCPIRKTAFRILECYYSIAFPLTCRVLQASLRLCGVHLCGRDSNQQFPEVCAPRNNCPSGFRERTNAVCGRRQDCCYSTANTCESLNVPAELDGSLTTPDSLINSETPASAAEKTFSDVGLPVSANDFYDEILSLAKSSLVDETPNPSLFGIELYKESLRIYEMEFLNETLRMLNETQRLPGSAVSEETSQQFGNDRFYTINHALGFRALCDTRADGGGWTVLQRRTSGAVSFDRGWNEYVNGFGNTDNGYWLGLRHARSLIERGDHEVRFEFTTSKRVSKVVQYNRFSIGPELDRYRLSISALDYNRPKSTESGFSIELHNLMRFTTRDRDNDVCLLCNCAVPGRGGWWHYSCATANLNGLWNFPFFNLGPSWIFDAGLNRPLRSTLMMIRRR